MIVRCKCFVSNVDIGLYNGCSYAIKLQPVYSPDEKTENHRFWEASPSGDFKLSGRDEILAQFTPGSFWYIDHWKIKETLPTEINEDNHLLITVVQCGRRNSLSKNKTEDDKLELTTNAIHVNLESIEGYSKNGCWPIQFEENIYIANKEVWDEYGSLDTLFRCKFIPATKEGL